MFKATKPKSLPLSATTVARFPHCDPRILHAPGECRFCDANPDWQRLREVWGIAFTGYTPEGKELPCPADFARGETHAKWLGNVAVPSSTNRTATGASLANTVAV